MSIFDDAEDLLAGAVTATMGDLVRIVPRQGGSQYATGGPDPSRPAREIEATFTEVADTEDIRGQKVGAELESATRIALAATDIEVSRIEYAKLGYAIRKNDLVVLMAAPGQPTYSITRVDRNGTGYIVHLALEDVP